MISISMEILLNVQFKPWLRLFGSPFNIWKIITIKLRSSKFEFQIFKIFDWKPKNLGLNFRWMSIVGSWWYRIVRTGLTISVGQIFPSTNCGKFEILCVIFRIFCMAGLGSAEAVLKFGDVKLKTSWMEEHLWNFCSSKIWYEFLFLSIQEWYTSQNSEPFCNQRYSIALIVHYWQQLNSRKH